MLIQIILWTTIWLAKAFEDGWRDGEKVVRPWLAKYGQRWVDWYDGRRGFLTTYIGQGWFWSSDYWHFWDNVRSGATFLSVLFSPWLFVGYSWWSIALIMSFCYWLPMFQLVFHVYLLRDWTFQRWFNNTILFWKTNK